MKNKTLMEHVNGLIDILAARPSLTRKDLARRYNRDVRTIDRWRRENRLPRPHFLPGSRVPLWRAIDLAAAESPT